MTDATMTPAVETVSYDVTAARTLTQQAQTVLTGAKSVVIDSEMMAEIAADDLKHCKALLKDVEAKRTAITVPLNAALKAVNDLFRAPKEYLETAERSLKMSLVAWTTEQERLAAVARAKAEAEARAERERLAAIAAQQAAEALALQKEAEAAAAAGDSAAAEAAQASAVAAQQQMEITEMTAAVITVTPEVSAPTKMAGIGSRVTYSAEVVDLLELVKAVAAGQAPLDCLAADMSFLSAQARAFKRVGSLYPGVEAKSDRSLSVRA